PRVTPNEVERKRQHPEYEHAGREEYPEVLQEKRKDQRDDEQREFNHRNDPSLCAAGRGLIHLTACRRDAPTSTHETRRWGTFDQLLAWICLHALSGHDLALALLHDLVFPALRHRRVHV